MRRWPISGLRICVVAVVPCGRYHWPFQCRRAVFSCAPASEILNSRSLPTPSGLRPRSFKIATISSSVTGRAFDLADRGGFIVRNELKRTDAIAPDGKQEDYKHPHHRPGNALQAAVGYPRYLAEGFRKRRKRVHRCIDPRAGARTAIPEWHYPNSASFHHNENQRLRSRRGAGGQRGDPFK